MKWIRSYYLAISEGVRKLKTNIFVVLREDNIEYTILVAINTNGIGINNPDVKLVI